VKDNEHARNRILQPKSPETRRKRLAKCVTYIHATLVASCLAENTGYRHDVERWVQDKFLPVASSMLGPSSRVLEPILSFLEQAQQGTCSADAFPSSGDGHEGESADGDVQIVAGHEGKSAGDDVQIVAVSSDIAQFRCVLERCYKCMKSTENPHVCDACKQVTCCRLCFGAAQNSAKRLKYVCNWCLRDFHTAQ
jgi:hypothetical protein